MANSWFRFYCEFANDAKVQMMSENDQRRLTMLFCLRGSNGDVTLHDEQIAFQLRISCDEWSRTKQLFVEKGFINKTNKLLNWDKRQYISDSSASRVAAYRARKKLLGNVTCNVTETARNESSNADVAPPDTDTDTDKEIYKEKFNEPTAITTEIVKQAARSELINKSPGDTMIKQPWFEKWKSVWGNLWKGEGTAKRFFYSVVETEKHAIALTEIAKNLIHEYHFKKKHGVLATFFTPTSFFESALWENYIMSDAEIIASKPAQKVGFAQIQLSPEEELSRKEQIRISNDKAVKESDENEAKLKKFYEEVQQMYELHWREHYSHVKIRSTKRGDAGYWEWARICSKIDEKLGISAGDWQIAQVLHRKPHEIAKAREVIATIDWSAISLDGVEK